jgi:hypothetical protein
VNRIVPIAELLAAAWQRCARQEGEARGDVATVLAVFALPTLAAFVAVSRGLPNVPGLLHALFHTLVG